MLKNSICGASCLLLLAFVMPQAISHHSITAEFDTSQQISFTGTVREVEWTNPHIWVYFDVLSSEGEVEKWQCEMGAPNRLIRLGWRKDDLPVGSTVEVSGDPARDGTNTCNARRVTLPDGRLVFQGDAAKEISP